MNEESRDHMNANDVIGYDPLIVHKAADVVTKILHIRFNTNGPLSPSDVGLLHAGAGELLKALAAIYIKGSLIEQVSLFREADELRQQIRADSPTLFAKWLLALGPWLCSIGRAGIEVGIDEEWKSL